jgi:hypothetical protein
MVSGGGKEGKGESLKICALGAITSGRFARIIFLDGTLFARIRSVFVIPIHAREAK